MAKKGRLDNVMQLSYNHNMIVFDASTLILLLKIDLLDTFISNYKGDLFIPEKVENEIKAGDKIESLTLQKLIKNKKIRVVKVKDNNLVKKLMEDFSIDKGEAEAITLALQKHADIIATDDRNAIRACKLLGINFTTAIAILIRSFEKKFLEREEALFKLKRLKSVARYKREILDNAEKLIKGGK